jgi:serine protease Do
MGGLNMYNNFDMEDNFYRRSVKPKRKGRLLTYISLILVTAVISTFVTGGYLYSRFSNEVKNITAQAARTQESTVKSAGVSNLTATALAKGSAVTEIAKKVGPSIVGIRMTVSPQRRGYYSFGSQAAEGSGIVISKDGYIMTNYHVVQYADPKSGNSSNTVLEVFLPDKRQAKAKFIGGDQVTDLAVIKIELDNLPAAELGDSSELEVGELAVAIGNPLGMEFAGSVTVGVISALNRTIDKEGLDLIQTDAAINPGNSGGALVNSQGQVIGINSAKIADTGIEGLGFAIPINDAKPIVDQLKMFGYVKGRPFIGISGQDITETISEAYGLPVGIYITDVTEGSGADKAGLMRGDILTSLDGKEVKSLNDLDAIKKGYKAGDTVKVTIVRDGVKKTLSLTFSEEK